MLSLHLEKQQINQLQFSQLQLCFRSIRVINRIPQTIKFISRLYLNSNHLMSLNGIQQFYNLQIFHFNYNLVSLPNQFEKVANPFFLREISFIGNPIYMCKIVDREFLRNKGYSRLEKVNELSQKIYSPPKNIVLKHKQKGNMQNQTLISIDTTARRRPAFKMHTDASKTDRKNVGKIYYNTKYKQIKQQNKNSPVLNTKQTRQSSSRPVLQESAIANRNSRHRTFENDDTQQIKPFETSVYDDLDETAKFSKHSNQNKFGIQFIQQQKELLTNLYYERILKQKSFKILKKLSKSINYKQDIQPYEGQIINNHLQTLHFSLIKLKHQLIQKT